MHRPTRTATFVAGAVLGVTTLVAPAASASDSHSSSSGHTILRADLMGSMPSPAGPTIAGVLPGGLPWVVDEGFARVREDGRVRVRVEGLVIPGMGTNGIVSVSATVVCNDMPAGTTGSVPLSADGDARIDDTVWLPDYCHMPVVLVNPNGNAARYIAATGL